MFGAAGDGTISGFVFEADGVTPVTTPAWVTVQDSVTSLWVSRVDVQADGSYTVDVPPGTYMVRAEGVNNAIEFYNNKGWQGYDSDFIVVTGGETETINFSLDPGGTISGIVYGPDGITPLPNMNITVRGSWDGTCTDQYGQFTVYSLPLNSPIKLGAGGSNWCNEGSQIYAQQWWDHAADENSAEAVVLTDAAPTRNDVNFTLDLAGIVTGTVYQADGVTPIPNLGVSFYNAATGNHVMGTGTDSSGNYTISLPAGTYTAEAHGDGWVSEYYNETDWQSATHIVVTAGGTVSGVNFTLDPAGMVTGTVYQADGVTPIPNAGVSFFDAATNQHIMGTGVDGSGNYTISLPAGTYAANAHTDGWVSEYYNEAGLDWQNATDIVVTVGNTVSGVNFTLDPAGMITGTVYQADGVTPIPFVSVSFFDAATGNHIMGTGTNDSGVYMISLPAGTYVANAHGDGWLTEYYNEAGWQDWQTATPIVVTMGGSVTGVNFTLEPAGTISGRVTAADGVTPLANMAIGTNQPLGACTNQDGYFTLESVPFNAPVSLWSGGSNNWCGGSTDYLQLWYDNAPDQQSATAITLTSSEPQRTNVNFALPQGAIISGMVYQSDGVTPITADVYIYAEHLPSGNNAGGSMVSPDGSYRITVPTGTYRVRAGGGSYAGEWFNNAGNNGNNATPVAATQGAVTPNINFTLDPGGTISGTVYAADGVTPLANMNVEAHNYWMGTCSDANGSFSLNNLPLGQPIKVYVTPNSWCGGGGLWMREWYNNAPDEQSATPIILSLAERDFTNAIFTLDLGGAISGHVYELDGVTPVEQVNVNAGPITSFSQDYWTQVNGDGTYLLAVPPGQYFVSASGFHYVLEYWNDSGYGADAPQDVVTVTAGAITPNIDFALAPAGEIHGVVYAADGVTPLANMNIGSSTPWMGACTNENGEFTIGSVPFNEPHHLSAGGTENWCGGSTAFAQTWWNQKPFEFQADGVTITAAAPVATGINFTLGAASSINGTVTAAENGAPLSGVWACAINHDANGFNETAMFLCDDTDANGAYSISVPPYSYRVWIFPDDRLRLFYNQAPRYEDALLVNVGSGVNVTGIDFSLPLAGIITGKIYLEDGITPAQRVTVSTADGSYMECTQEDGSYRIFVPAGTHVVRAGAGACDPNVAFPTQYYNGVFDVPSATPITIAAGETRGNINFVRGDQAFMPPILLTPYGDTPSSTPIFNWSTTTGATWYQVWISQLDGMAQIDRWYEASACSGGTCSANDISLMAGAYRWWARAWRADLGYSAWSAPLEFQISVQTGTPTQVAPFGLETSLNPTYTWNAVSGASWYYVWVNNESGKVLDHWYAAADACIGSVCSWTPAESLGSGDHQWWVQAWGEFGGYSAWSAGLSFSVPFQTAPTQNAPAGQLDTPPVALTWADMPGSSWWQVWFSSEHGGGGGYWYDAATICAAGSCSIVPPVTVDDDVYSWWVQTWNPVTGYSLWSGGMTFWLPLAAPTLIAPSGTVTTGSPVFTWDHQDHAEWYLLWVSGGVGVHVIDQWYNASAICAGETCSVQPVSVPNGTYYWWVQAWSPYSSYSPWSADGVFTVEIP
ncbi:MAG: carboxypeptidase regulatory-like domain-containing protein [Anaerolinea sp.]|nr:carboxypeptidase regulatory-like domain-containing protein [Anaerolinea sp.]